MGRLKNEQMTELSKEFEELTSSEVYELIQDVGDEGFAESSVGKRAIIREHIRSSDPEHRVDVISAYATKIFPKDSQLRRMNDILSGSGYRLTYIGEEVKLIDNQTVERKEEHERHATYIEMNAPKETYEKIKSARNYFAKNKYEQTCSELRKALESMVTTEYHEGLNELKRKGLIYKHSQDHMILDRDVLYTAYGYNSSVGSHNKANDPEPYQEQAEFALSLTEETIYFLLRRLEEADNKDIQLECWAM